MHRQLVRRRTQPGRDAIGYGRDIHLDRRGSDPESDADEVLAYRHRIAEHETVGPRGFRACGWAGAVRVHAVLRDLRQRR